MTYVVASHFAWNEYPGLRAGRIYRGAPDVSRRPLGEVHLIDRLDAAETLCGLPRTSFPHDFPELAAVSPSDPCATCQAADSALTGAE